MVVGCSGQHHTPAQLMRMTTCSRPVPNVVGARTHACTRRHLVYGLRSQASHSMPACGTAYCVSRGEKRDAEEVAGMAVALSHAVSRWRDEWGDEAADAMLDMADVSAWARTCRALQNRLFRRVMLRFCLRKKESPDPGQEDVTIQTQVLIMPETVQCLRSAPCATIGCPGARNERCMCYGLWAHPCRTWLLAGWPR